jgi:ribosome-binding protein aMBF1 (putative translation factor)
VKPRFVDPESGYPKKESTLGRTFQQGLSMEKSTFTRNYSVVRQLLREYRQNQGMTQAELAAKLESPQSYISKCESGERRVDLVQLEAFCSALGVSLSEFVARYLQATRSKRRRG